MKKYSLKEIASLTSSKLVGDPDHVISSVAGLETASKSDVSFLANDRYEEAMKQSNAGLICVDKDKKIDEHPDKNFLLSENPSFTFQKIIEIFSKQTKLTGFNEKDKASIHPSAKISPSALINPYAVIDENVTIDKETFIASNVYVGPNVKIGKNCIIHPGCTIRENTIIKDRVILQPGAVIGSCGFGFITDEKGIHQKLQQIGNVVIEEDVEIGANTTIDRARFHSTIIKKGTKIDNLVQIAHNCEIGPFNLLAGQTGVAGSSKTGSYVFCGGQVGILGHVEIASDTKIATRSGVSKSLTSGIYRGSPAQPIEKFNRQKVFQRKLESYVKRIEELESKIKELEEKTQ